MYISVKAPGGIHEQSIDFDHVDVDHNALALLIGNTVVRAINQVRTRGGTVVYSQYIVKLDR